MQYNFRQGTAQLRTLQFYAWQSGATYITNFLIVRDRSILMSDLNFLQKGEKSRLDIEKFPNQSLNDEDSLFGRGAHQLLNHLR